jgi:hypothetical protein
MHHFIIISRMKATSENIVPTKNDIFRLTMPDKRPYCVSSWLLGIVSLPSRAVVACKLRSNQPVVHFPLQTANVRASFTNLTWTLSSEIELLLLYFCKFSCRSGRNLLNRATVLDDPNQFSVMILSSWNHKLFIQVCINCPNECSSPSRLTS